MAAYQQLKPHALQLEKFTPDSAPYIVKLASYGCIVVGSLVLLGWAFGIEPLKVVFPGLVSMKVNTAICFVLLGSSLQLSMSAANKRWQLRLSKACATLPIAIGIATLIEYLFACDLGIDNLLVKDWPPRDPCPGRPAMATAFNFCLLGFALIARRTQHSWVRLVVESVLLFVFLISSLALVGYVYGVASLYGFYPFSSMALHTALVFLLISLGILYSRSDFVLMRPMRSDGPGGIVARRMLPAVFLITTALGWLRLQGQLNGMYGLEFGLAMHCVAMIAIFAILVWWISGSLDASAIQRRRAEADLAHVLRINSMNEMAAGISHELNQPLSSILNFASGTARRLKNRGATDAEVIEVVEAIAEESARASDIVRSLNRYARKCDPQRASVDLNAVVEGALRIMAGEIRHRGVSVTRGFDPGLREISGDHIQLIQVIVNLLSNALDALVNSPDKSILVETRRLSHSEIEVRVADRGCGLPPGMDFKIFEAFYTTKPDGLGMGLAISRSIVEAHGGRLWAERNDGAGMTFRFVVPLKAAGAV